MRRLIAIVLIACPMIALAFGPLVRNMMLEIASRDDADVSDPYLVAWYKLDGDALDSSLQEQHGTWPVGTETYTNGPYAGTQAAWFDGATKMNATQSAALCQPTNSVTLAFWMRPAATSGGAQYLVRRTSDGGELSLIYEYKEDQVEFFAAGYTGDNPRAGFVIATTDWHHVAWTLGGGVLAGYKNGVQVYSQAKNTSLKVGLIGGAFKLGGSGSAAFYNGAMFDFRVYNRALSSTDIIRIMNGLKPRHD